jgi:hypothetical protein
MVDPPLACAADAPSALTMQLKEQNQRVNIVPMLGALCKLCVCVCGGGGVTNAHPLVCISSAFPEAMSDAQCDKRSVGRCTTSCCLFFWELLLYGVSTFVVRRVSVTHRPSHADAARVSANSHRHASPSRFCGACCSPSIILRMWCINVRDSVP